MGHQYVVCPNCDGRMVVNVETHEWVCVEPECEYREDAR